MALVILKDVAIGTTKCPVSSSDLHIHNLISEPVKLFLCNSANLIWFDPPYVRGKAQSVLSKPFSWPDKSENMKEQNFSQDQTEANLFKSSVLL